VLTPAPVDILIVDDEPKNLTVLAAILDDPGYRLVAAIVYNNLDGHAGLVSIEIQSLFDRPNNAHK
jgi:CheY-like chemotaxis protein